MLIDWFTVCAQLLNFMALIWLMKRFLYKPVLDAIDARERRIAAELAQADSGIAEAHKSRDEWQRKSDAIDGERAALIGQCTAETDAARLRLLGEARVAGDALLAARRTAMASDAARLDVELRQRVQTEVYAIARQALHDVAGASFDAGACDLFVARLLDPASAGRKEWMAALEGSPVVVRSAFELQPPQRASLQAAIDVMQGAHVAMSFETRPAVVSGIEIAAGGHKIEWSIDGYLASLELKVGALLAGPGRA